MTETTAFYRDVMGFPIETELTNWVSFRVGATLLTLRPRGNGPAWDDGPAEPPYNSRTLFFRDPEDNVIEIYAEY